MVGLLLSEGVSEGSSVGDRLDFFDDFFDVFVDLGILDESSDVVVFEAFVFPKFCVDSDSSPPAINKLKHPLMAKSGLRGCTSFDISIKDMDSTGFVDSSSSVQ